MIVGDRGGMSGKPFDQRQKNYYVQEINRSLPVPDARIATQAALADAVGTVYDIQNSKVNMTDAASLFATFGRDANVIRRDEECRTYTAPAPGMRDPGARTGCGWWYVPIQGAQSMGAYGTRRGPMSPDLDQKVGPGQWVWDLQQAQQLEGMKQAGNVKSCSDLQYNRYPNMGWCTSTNMGIVTDGNGNPAYPKQAGGDCPNGSIIMSANACPPPASAQKQQGSITGLCQPGTNGALSPACLQSLVQQGGCSSNGTLAMALGSGGYADTYSGFNDINAVLQQRGFSLPSGVVHDGMISTQDALTAAYSLRTKANAGDNSRATQAAKNMCMGAPFDPCAFADTDSGPYPASCITQAALKAGWAAQGSLMPANGGMKYWNSLPTWADVKTAIATNKSEADTPNNQNASLQTQRIGQVYGMGVKYPKQGCNNFGVLMYRYFFPTWDQTLFTAMGPQTHFLGRYIFKDGFPYKPSTMEDQTPAGSYLTEGQRYVAMFTPTQGGTYQFLLGHDDGVRLLINDQVFMDWAPCCGSTTTNTIQMVAGQPYKLSVDLWNGGGPWSFIFQMSVNGGAWQNIPLQQLSMTQDRRLPTFELAFNKMSTTSSGAGSTEQPAPIQDTNGVFQNLIRLQAPIGQLNGRQCLQINGNGSGVYNFGYFSQGVRVRAFKSYTMMLQINSVKWGSGASPSIFSLYNLPSTNITSYPRKGSPQDSWDFPNQTQQFMITASATQIYPWGKGIYSGSSQDVSKMFGANSPSSPQITPGQWFHFAMVWDDDFSGYVLYLNGNPSQHYACAPYDITTIMEQMRIGSDWADDKSGWTGGIAWFRAFDYRLSQDLIQRDMNDDWANLY